MQELKQLKNKFDHLLSKEIENFGEKNALRDACEYALLSGGKRIRPLIVYLMAEALDKGYEVTFSAFAVEFFHTASIIADDLPCMDNDDFRRNKPSLHKAYKEDIAVLTSFTLISAGYEYIHKNALQSSYSDKICVTALGVVSKAAGIFGATSGQFYDLYPADQTMEMVETIIYRKTITLFEIAFILGWLFGGGDISCLNEVKRLAYHLGMAFQIGDDLEDIIQDQKEEITIVKLLGIDSAHERFLNEIKAFSKVLKELGLETNNFKSLIQALLKKQNGTAKQHQKHCLIPST